MRKVLKSWSWTVCLYLLLIGAMCLLAWLAGLHVFGIAVMQMKHSWDGKKGHWQYFPKRYALFDVDLEWLSSVEFKEFNDEGKLVDRLYDRKLSYVPFPVKRDGGFEHKEEQRRTSDLILRPLATTAELREAVRLYWQLEGKLLLRKPPKGLRPIRQLE